MIYDPIVYWTWNSNGWLKKLGMLDYAGGTPVHINAGFTALAYSMMLGHRLTMVRMKEAIVRPHSSVLVVIGTAFMWIGWLGFSAGSSYKPDRQAVQAVLNTQFSASVGGLVWVLMDYRLEKKWSIVGFCSGIVSGLVCVTPGAGYVSPWAAMVMGLAGGFCCNLATKIKFYLDIDDVLDVFSVHAVGGLVGNLLTGLFAAESNQSLVVQTSFQFLGSICGAGYAFIATVIILSVMDKIPGLKLNVTLDQELQGMDISEHDELAYDYVEMLDSLFERLPPTDSNTFSFNERYLFDGSSDFDQDQIRNFSPSLHSIKPLRTNHHRNSMFPGISEATLDFVSTEGEDNSTNIMGEFNDSLVSLTEQERTHFPILDRVSARNSRSRLQQYSSGDTIESSNRASDSII